VIKVATGQEENEEEEKHPFGSPKEMEILQKYSEEEQSRMCMVTKNEMNQASNCTFPVN
jgi:hypothetical protein